MLKQVRESAWHGKGTRLWYCPNAIGAQMWNPYLNRHEMPEGDPHTHVKKWSEVELVYAGDDKP
jgi:hypothetical protein